MPIFIRLTIQDWLIAVACFIIILCVLRIRNLKKTITQEIQRQVLPQLILEMNKKEMCFYLKNEGFSIIQDIQIADLGLTLDDSGFNVDFILRFESKGYLRPKEDEKLKLKVFDKNQTFLPEVTERMFNHLIGISFNIEISCSDIEGRHIQFLLSKKGDKFYTTRGPSRTPFCPVQNTGHS
jgi:hypothetical protein